jgi:hypothetical protein
MHVTALQGSGSVLDLIAHKRPVTSREANTYEGYQNVTLALRQIYEALPGTREHRQPQTSENPKMRSLRRSSARNRHALASSTLRSTFEPLVTHAKHIYEKKDLGRYAN